MTIISLYPINFVWRIRRWGKILRGNNITMSNISLYPLSLYPLYTVLPLVIMHYFLTTFHFSIRFLLFMMATAQSNISNSSSGSEPENVLWKHRATTLSPRIPPAPLNSILFQFSDCNYSQFLSATNTRPKFANDRNGTLFSRV